MKKLLIVIIIVLLLLGACIEVEKMTTPDGTAPMTEQLLKDAGEGISEIFGQIKDGISSIFNSIADYFKKDDSASAEIGEISIDELPEEAQELYGRYENDGWKTTSQDLDGKTEAGDEYQNRSKVLPSESSDGNNITYKEYDAENTSEGKNRGKKRFVHGSDGSTYYTDDHYRTFRKVVK